MVFHWLALLFFTIAFGLHWVYVRSDRHLSRLYGLPIILAGFLFLTVQMVQRGLQIGACPVGNPFEIINLIVWSSVFFYLVVSLVVSVNYLGFFTAGFSSVVLLILQVFPALNYGYDASQVHSSHIIGFHASLAVFSYGIFALLSLLALMHLIQFYGLTRHRANGFFSILPPLMKLEKLELWMLVLGVFVMSVSLFVGSFSFITEIGDAPVYKVAATVLLWFIYLIILLLRLFHRLVSARFSWMLMIAFAFALLALVPVDRARHELIEQAPSQSQE